MPSPGSTSHEPLRVPLTTTAPEESVHIELIDVPAPSVPAHPHSPEAKVASMALVSSDSSWSLRRCPGAVFFLKKDRSAATRLETNLEKNRVVMAVPVILVTAGDGRGRVPADTPAPGGASVRYIDPPNGATQGTGCRSRGRGPGKSRWRGGGGFLGAGRAHVPEELLWPKFAKSLAVRGLVVSL